MRHTPIAAALLVFAASCQSFPTVHGSGLVLTEERDVSSFHAVDVSGSADVILTQGEGESLSIECDDNLLPHIRSTVSDGVLRLRFENGSWSPSERTVYRIGIEDVESVRLRGSVSLVSSGLEGRDVDLHISGSGSAHIESLRSEATDFTTSGSGDLRLGSIETGSLHIGVSGSGEVTVGSGTVGRMDASTSGSSDLDMPGVQVQSASVRISGSGTAMLWVEDDLSARISGSGEVGYRGQPAISTSISGSGDIHSLRHFDDGLPSRPKAEGTKAVSSGRSY